MGTIQETGLPVERLKQDVSTGNPKIKIKPKLKTKLATPDALHVFSEAENERVPLRAQVKSKNQPNWLSARWGYTTAT